MRDNGPPELLNLAKIDDSVLSYGRFLRRFMLKSSRVTKVEHAALLLLWFSKYVFFHPALKVSKDLLGIALGHAEGMPSTCSCCTV